MTWKPLTSADPRYCRSCGFSTDIPKEAMFQLDDGTIMRTFVPFIPGIPYEKMGSNMRTGLRWKYREKFPRIRETQTPEDQKSLVLRVQLFPLKVISWALYLGELEEGGPKAPVLTHKHWDVMHSMVTTLNCCVSFRKVIGRVRPGSSHQKKINTFSFRVCTWWWMLTKHPW